MISVIIPNYNRAESIGLTIKNLLCQSLSPDEIIVVDDGSTDNSIDVIKEFGDKVVLIQQKNQGPGAARNRGLELAKGEYIQFMDSDDLMSLNKLELQFKALQDNEFDFAYCAWNRCDISKDGDIKMSKYVLQGEALPLNRTMLEWQLGSWSIIFQNCLFKKEALIRAGKYAEDMKIAEDGEYLVRVLMKGAKPIFTPNCMVYYNVSGENHITGTGSSQVRQAEDLTKYYERTIKSIAPLQNTLSKQGLKEFNLLLYRHINYCRAYGISVLNEKELKEQGFLLSKLSLIVADYGDRIKRKFKKQNRAIPSSKGMMVKRVSIEDMQLKNQVQEAFKREI